MNASNESNGYAPKVLTAEYMKELFEGVAHHKNYKPYKSELEQFFRSRIWMIIQEETRPVVAGMYIALSQKPMSDIERATIASSINIMLYWLNLENNIFAARERSLSLSDEQVGGESWQDR